MIKGIFEIMFFAAAIKGLLELKKKMVKRQAPKNPYKLEKQIRMRNNSNWRAK